MHCAVLTARAARLADFFSIDLPHPRTLDMKTMEACGRITQHIYALLGME
jgi:NitT/TauT family transport system ATP-binding protein